MLFAFGWEWKAAQAKAENITPREKGPRKAAGVEESVPGEDAAVASLPPCPYLPGKTGFTAGLVLTDLTLL